MLTTDDLEQIRGIVQGETRKIVKEELKTEISPLKKDIKELKTDIKILQKDVTKIRKDVDTIVNYFDREYLEPRERVEKIEHHLGINFSS